MASETKFAGAASSVGVGNAAWTNPNNVTADDGVYAFCDMDDMEAPDDTQYLVTSSHGFAVSGTIDGIEVEIQRKRSTGSGSQIEDLECKLVIGGSIVGDNKANTGAGWGTTDAVVVYGGPTDKWGLSPTAEQINASNFGFAIRVWDANERGLDAQIDYVKITVYYTPDEGGGGDDGDGALGARRVILFGVGRGICRGIGGS